MVKQNKYKHLIGLSKDDSTKVKLGLMSPPKPTNGSVTKKKTKKKQKKDEVLPKKMTQKMKKVVANDLSRQQEKGQIDSKQKQKKSKLTIQQIDGNQSEKTSSSEKEKKTAVAKENPDDMIDSKKKRKKKQKNSENAHSEMTTGADDPDAAAPAAICNGKTKKKRKMAEMKEVQVSADANPRKSNEAATKQTVKKKKKKIPMQPIVKSASAVVSLGHVGKDDLNDFGGFFETLPPSDESVDPSSAVGSSGVSEGQSVANDGESSKQSAVKPKQENENNHLHEKMADRLNAARFRFINEQLYTRSGREALQLFTEDPDAFQVYHAGYKKQMDSWPYKPVDWVIKELRSRGKGLTVADMGCGEGEVALAVSRQHTVHSFDLIARHPHITVAEMSKLTSSDGREDVGGLDGGSDLVEPETDDQAKRNRRFIGVGDLVMPAQNFCANYLRQTMEKRSKQVPLGDNSVDVVVFCLSLMGTNLSDYLIEARRILKPEQGTLLIAEISSRFGQGFNLFKRNLESLGFLFVRKSQPNAYFTTAEFTNEGGGGKLKRKTDIKLNPCLYKKR